jgi:hypothetical protein
MDQEKKSSTLKERMSDSDITTESPPKPQGGSKSQKDGESPKQ